MRILILSDRIPPEHIGGAEKVAWALALALHYAGHQVHVIAATKNAPFRDIREGISTYHLHSHYPERWRSWFSLYNPQIIPALNQLLCEIKPDIMHAHNIHADLSYASLRAASKLGIPVVFTAHDLMPVVYDKLDYFIEKNTCEIHPEKYHLPFLYNLRSSRFRYNPVRNVLIRHFLKQYTKIRTAVSSAQKMALEANGLPPFEIVHNGIETAPFDVVPPENVAQLRTRFHLIDKKVILFGGRLSAGKGSRLLIQALDKVIQQLPDLRLLVLSGKPLDPELLQGNANLTVDHLVEGGWLNGSELQAAYKLANVVTVPSIYLDPFPTINLEGMAAARPIVATCFGGSSDVVVNGETGYIINPFNRAEFAARLTELLSNQQLCQQMGEAGRQRISEHFTLAQQRDAMLERYQRALAL